MQLGSEILGKAALKILLQVYLLEFCWDVYQVTIPFLLS